MATEKILCIGDLEAAASKILPVSTRDFYNSGSTNQVTVRENSTAYNKYRILPRVLKDVSQVNTSTTLFDRNIKFPLCVAPAGLQAMAHPDGELATSRACARVGVHMGVSSYANHSVEQITSAGTEIGPIHHVMQLYSMTDREKEARIVRRAEASGCKAIFLTADSPVLGVRYNEWRSGFQAPLGLGYPMIEKTTEQIQQESHDEVFSSFNSDSHSWAREIPWLRSITNMEIWIKGVLTPEDVEMAIEYGCDGVIISNHGGRQLDETPATIDVPLLAQRLREAESESISTGASGLVATSSKRWHWERSVVGSYNGQKGVELMLEVLYNEFKRCMQLTGCKSVSEIRSSSLGIVRSDGPLARL
ncbi:oxidoreductase [Penicillium canariense]|uniref:Oxidoreductase n=1 Tax=Penicillium canariense TaxID=189055 RepID=A0A9W9LJT7_9EURO|nr:oxidoreductase [Penicillium canariense]KAJ5159903.1 oxidoreductase [Penicillium canariense]